MSIINVQPVPDYGDDHSDDSGPMPDYEEDYDDQASSNDSRGKLSHDSVHEDIAADYDDSISEEEMVLPTVHNSGKGIENKGFVPNEEDFEVKIEPMIEVDEAVGGVNEEPIDIESVPARESIVVATTPEVLIAPEILAAADANALEGRLTEDGNLLSNRPHRRQMRQRHKMIAAGEVGQQLDELYREHKRQDGTQLLETSTVKLTGFEKWKFEQSKKWKKSSTLAKEALADITIWNSAFKDIEGRFGSPVLAYFRFLKWLFLLNLLLALLILGVLVLPQVLMHPSTFEKYLETRSSTDSRFGSAFASQANNCTLSYTSHVTAVIDNSTIVVSILDFIQGTGWMEQTPVFIGYYFNRTYTNIITSHHVHYNMAVAYLISVMCYFLISLFLMVRFTAQGMKSSIASTSDQFYKACNKVFCGWDFSLAERKAVVFKHNQLFQEYIRDIDVQRRKERLKNQTRAKKCQMLLIRALMNVLVIAILGASGYLIYYMTQQSSEWLKDGSVLENPFLKLFIEFLPSLTITFLNFMAPLIFQRLVLLEGYSPTLEIKITIIRSVILRLASVAVLVLGVGVRLIQCDKDDECNTCQDITRCWETYLGQQFYKLVLLDFATVIFMTFFVQFPRKFIVAKFKNVKFFKMIGYQEFEIPKEVLDIVYTQTLCWIGGFLSPIIFCMTVLKMFFFFYIKKLALLNTCNPSTRLFRASNSQSFFMTMLLLSFVLCALPVSFAIGKISPSKSCSPFRLYSSDEYFMFTSLVDLLHGWPHWLQSLIRFMTSWTFYMPLIIIMCLVIYFYVSVAAGKRQHLKILLEQLALEGKDKQYLLAQVRQAIARGDFKKEQ